MKFIYLFILGILAFPSISWAQSFQFMPERPMPGDTIQVIYNPSKTVLKNADQIKASIYFLEDSFPEENSFEIPIPKPKYLSIDLKKKNKVFVGDFVVTKNAKVLKLLFYNVDKRLDNNNREGYTIMTYQPEKKQVVQGAFAQLGLSKITHAFFMGINPDGEAALESFKKEFELFPDSKDNFIYFMTFSSLSLQLGDLQSLEQAKSQLDYLFEKEEPTEMNLNLAFSLAQLLKKKDLEEIIYKKIEKNYPNSVVVELETLNQFYDAKDLKEKEKLFKLLQENFNSNPAQQSSLKDAALVLANIYLNKNPEKFAEYAKLAKNRVNLASQANAIAWELVGGGVAYPAKDLKKAKKMAAIALNLIEIEIESPSFDTKAYPNELKKLNDSYAAIADTYALIAYKLGNSSEAFQFQEKALQNDPDPKLEILDRYTLYFDEQFSDEETKRILGEMIRRGKFTQRMEDRFVELANRKEFNQLLKSSEQESMEELKGRMIQKIAPDFSLKNLDGEVVKLSDLKGKIVVLDFWATWCKPCLISFPGMQEVLDQYKTDTEVEFLFIDCWEPESVGSSVISEFLAAENYSFHVLLDESNETVKSYEIDGIPAKFVIDKKGNIRFQDAGFKGHGNLVKELTARIEILKRE